MDPIRQSDRVMDAAGGRHFFRRWLDEAMDGLRNAAEAG
jgi:hypothetical protein